jgi:hypothetical protein
MEEFRTLTEEDLAKEEVKKPYVLPVWSMILPREDGLRSRV